MKSQANCYAIWIFEAPVSEMKQKLRSFYGRKYNKMIFQNFHQVFKHRFFSNPFRPELNQTEEKIIFLFFASPGHQNNIF